MVELLPFRLYVKKGCPWCVKAELHLHSAGVPWEGLVAEQDPIIAAGLEKVFGEPVGLPILVAFDSSEIITGYKEGDFNRVVQFYRDRASAGVRDGSLNDQPVVRGDAKVSGEVEARGTAT